MAWVIKDELEHAGLAVCGMVTTESEAIRIALAGRPDLVLVKPWLAQGSGLEAAWVMTTAGLAVLSLSPGRSAQR
jgi:hypothetical protein